MWVALLEPAPEDLDTMQAEFDLHPLAVEDARHGHQRPKIEEYGDSLFVVLHLVEVDSNRRPLPGTGRAIPADLVLLALGFSGPDRRDGLIDQLGLELEPRGTIARDADFATNVPGVFAAGDAARGQSLIVWAIAEGRAVAAAVDRRLTGGTSRLPAPISPYDRPMTV